MAAALLGLAPLCWIVGHAGPTQGTAVVHVIEPDVEVSVGGLRHRVDGRRYDPIVCDLRAGRHDLVMRREGVVLHREPFELGRGRSIVLTAWWSTRDQTSGVPDSRGRRHAQVYFD